MIFIGSYVTEPPCFRNFLKYNIYIHGILTFLEGARLFFFERTKLSSGKMNFQNATQEIVAQVRLVLLKFINLFKIF